MSHLATWRDRAAQQLAKNIRFWMGTGMSLSDASARAFAASAGGPKVRDAALRLVAQKNPHYTASFIAPDTAKVVKLFSKSGFTDIHMKKINPESKMPVYRVHPRSGRPQEYASFSAAKIAADATRFSRGRALKWKATKHCAGEPCEWYADDCDAWIEKVGAKANPRKRKSRRNPASSGTNVTYAAPGGPWITDLRANPKKRNPAGKRYIEVGANVGDDVVAFLDRAGMPSDVVGHRGGKAIIEVAGTYARIVKALGDEGSYKTWEWFTTAKSNPKKNPGALTLTLTDQYGRSVHLPWRSVKDGRPGNESIALRASFYTDSSDPSREWKSGEIARDGKVIATWPRPMSRAGHTRPAKRNPSALRWVKHHPHLGEKRPNYSAAAQGGAFKITPFPMGGWTVKWADATHEARVGNFSTLPLAKAAAARAEVAPKRNPRKHAMKKRNPADKPWALAKRSGWDDNVVSMHETREAAEAALAKKTRYRPGWGDTPQSVGYMIVKTGKGTPGKGYYDVVTIGRQKMLRLNA